MKKFLLILLALLTLVVLVSCNGNTPDAPVDDTTTAQTQVTEPEPDPITVFADGASQYKLIRPDEASQEVIDAFVALKDAMNAKYGISFSLATDFEMRDFDIAQRHKYEIVVGATNREESASALNDITYNESLIRVDGTRLVIIGGNDAATVKAIEHFIENCLTDGSLELCGELYRTPADQLGYLKNAIKLDGVDISDFTLVYGAPYRSAAIAMSKRLGMLCGAVCTTANDASEKTEHEIILGSAKRGVSSDGLGVDDFSITVKDGNIYIAGGSVNAVATGAARFIDSLEQGADELTMSSLAQTYTLPDREVYINDISKLALNWELEFDTPEWMLDFDEKYASLLDPDGRIMSCLHRGDMQRYPENSIEGIISAVRMGGDMIEIDPRLTKDGVFVLLHDMTLTRTTDFSEKAGKNGLPTSPNVYDWTYDQLMQLNLKEGAGGASAKVTPYKIPTLEEAIKVSANRIFIRLDVKGKTGASGEAVLWNYESDIWPLLQEYGAEANVIFTWHSAFTSGSYRLVKKYKPLQLNATGKEGIFFIGCSASKSANSILSTIKNNGLDPCVRLTDYDGSLDYQKYIEKNSSKLAKFKGTVRLYIDAHHDEENAETWNALNEVGINLLLVNKGFDLCRHIAKLYTK